MKLEEMKKVAEEIFSERKEVIVAYIYGSFLRSEFFEDIDVGLLIEDSFKPNALYEARIAGQFEQKLKGKLKNFNVGVLNGGSVRYLFSVLKNSKVLYSRDERKRVEFESKVMKEYLDVKPHHELYEKLRRLRYGG
jgi:hypothetical protein